MANLVLYRKYRPQQFKEVVGQEHVVITLTNALKQGIVSHGYLFSGPHGCGKTTIARLLAKSLNCEKRKKEDFEPCCSCDSCLEIKENRAIDLIEIDAASNRGIDEIRDLKEGIKFRPSKSKYKIFIIDEAHQLTKEASNALLKTLEEPPSHAIFILATTEIHKMIPTIQSRCQGFNFRKLKQEEIVKRLKGILEKEKIKYEEEALNLIAQKASGAQRDAETLLDEAISFSSNKVIEKETVRMLLGTADISSLFTFITFLAEKDTKKGIDFLNNLIFQGIDLKEFSMSLLEYLRKILILKIDKEAENYLLPSLTPEEKQIIQDLALRFSGSEIKRAIERFMQAEEKMRFTSIIQLPLELAVVDVCQKNQ